MKNQSNFLFSTELTELNENIKLYLNNLLEETIITIENLLQQLASNTNFDLTIQTAFGHNIDTELLQKSWITREFVFPNLEIVDCIEINNANGAFARDTNKIYLAREFLLENINNLDAVTDVVLEEYGHFIDSQLNMDDAPGDEGAIFASLVRDEELSKSRLEQLRNENDIAAVVLRGKKIEIEQNSTGTTTIVSVASDGTQANSSYNYLPSISSDGRYVAFLSNYNFEGIAYYAFPTRS